jgi:hypothetical protein
MDTKSKVIIWFFIATSLFLFAYEYKKIFVDGNYVLKTEVSCDPGIASCFVSVCSEDDGEECEETTFAKITKNIRGVELCDQYKDDCPDLACEPGELNCLVTYCSPDDLEEGEVCAGPSSGDDGSQGESATTSPEGL